MQRFRPRRPSDHCLPGDQVGDELQCFTFQCRPGGLHRKSRSLLRELPQDKAARRTLSGQGPSPVAAGPPKRGTGQVRPGRVRNRIEAGGRRPEPRKDSPNPWFGGKNRVNGKSRPVGLGHPTRSSTRVRSFGERVDGVARDCAALCASGAAYIESAGRGADLTGKRATSRMSAFQEL